MDWSLHGGASAPGTHGFVSSAGFAGESFATCLPRQGRALGLCVAAVSGTVRNWRSPKMGPKAAGQPKQTRRHLRAEVHLGGPQTTAALKDFL